MSSIENIGQIMATDGQIPTRRIESVKKVGTGYEKPANVNAEVAEVAQDFAKENINLERQISQIQKLSDSIGRKLEFKINEELNTVVVEVIDPSTKQVIKEIPSEEIQTLQMRLRKNISFLIDEKV